MKTRTVAVLVVWGAILALAVAVLAVVWIVRDADDDASPATEASIAPTGGIDRFYEQEIVWEECERSECTWVTVPVDYADPDGETVRLRVLRVPSTSGNAERSLLINPGGPGGSAIDFASTMRSAVSAEVREVYDIVAVDPRGVGESTPLECMGHEAFDEFINVDPTPDDATEVAALREAMEALGTACEDEGGALASHVSTQEAARDMDIVRALLGHDTLDWYGASYGTYLGAAYAAQFPDKVGRMILDGAVDPTMSPYDGAMGQTTGFQRALEAYAQDCVSGGSCPLGSNAESGIRHLEVLLEQLDASPLPTDSGRELTQALAYYGIAVPLYSEESWPYLSDALRQAFSGDGSGLLWLSDRYFERTRDGSFANNGSEVFHAVNCLDATERPSEDEVRADLDDFRSASQVFGDFMGWGALACTDWPLTSSLEVLDFAAAGAPPILVFGTTRDSATPYEWAEALADQLESGVLITRDGDGHTAYLSGNTCIAKVVDDFLLDGIVPSSDPRC